ncbi:four helix bundle protein [Vandammella animalimorsus]|uniref:four helix bundle protein n=1 Tax=Vandammella animalimorsus TaxID=2029117 RepID=UPI001EED0E66|nr:four helix bundle protein [Vandammella animalimorsus]
MKVRNFRDLIAWQVSFELAKRIYWATENYPPSEHYGLRAQMRRAGVSIASNLAEGAGRSTKKDFSSFVTIARGSLNELQTQTLLSVELGYLAQADAAQLQALIDRLYGLLNGLRNSLNAER